MPGFRSFAYWVLALCCAALLVATPLRAQENLDQGKTPAQLFNGDCSVCHNSPNGLSKTTDSRAVADFLRQHYTASRETASALAAFLTGQADPSGKQKPTMGRPAERATPVDRVAPAAPVVRRGGLFGIGDDPVKPDVRDDPPPAAAPASRQRRPAREAAKPSEAKPSDAKPSEAKPAEAGEEKKDEAAKPEARPRRASRSETVARPPKPVEGVKPTEGSDEKKDEQPEIARPERAEPRQRRQARPADAAKPAATEGRKRTSAAPKDAAKEAPKPASHVSPEPKEAPAAAAVSAAPAAASPPASPPAAPPPPAVPSRKDDIAD